MYPKRYDEYEVGALFTKGYSREYYLREIQRLTELPLKTVQRVLEYLEQSHLVIGRIKGKNKYFSLNLANVDSKFFITQCEVHKTVRFLSAYPVFKAFLKSCEGNDLFLVFGSFAKFVAAKDSDLDLMVVMLDNKKTLWLELLPHRVHDIVMGYAAFKRAVYSQETLLKEVEENHIILSGHSSYVNVWWDYYAAKKS